MPGRRLKMDPSLVGSSVSAAVTTAHETPSTAGFPPEETATSFTTSVWTSPQPFSTQLRRLPELATCSLPGAARRAASRRAPRRRIVVVGSAWSRRAATESLASTIVASGEDPDLPAPRTLLPDGARSRTLAPGTKDEPTGD